MTFYLKPNNLNPIGPGNTLTFGNGATQINAQAFFMSHNQVKIRAGRSPDGNIFNADAGGDSPLVPPDRFDIQLVYSGPEDGASNSLWELLGKRCRFTCDIPNSSPVISRQIDVIVEAIKPNQRLMDKLEQSGKDFTVAFSLTLFPYTTWGVLT